MSNYFNYIAASYAVFIFTVGGYILYTIWQFRMTVKKLKSEFRNVDTA